MSQSMNPKNLPASLRPLLPLFEKWGHVGSDSGRYTLMDRALKDPNEMAELKAWHTEWSQIDIKTYGEWYDGSLSECYERAKVYFTDMLLYGELEIDKR